MKNKIKEIISCTELHNLFPLASELSHDICKHRQEIQNILSNLDNRLLLIVGPCSAWPNEAVLEYAKRLSKLSQIVSKNIKVIMRVYIHKPRTTIGWQGSLMQPDPYLDVDINAGLKYSRAMMLAVAKLGLPIASEILNINLHNHYIDLLSWVAIGARSSENQEHRLFASYLDIPTGLKNPTHGSLEVAINSVLTAQHYHQIILNNHQVTSSGNRFAHLVLRGGNKQPNFAKQNLELIATLFKQKKIINPALIIDVSHDNAIKNKQYDYTLQAQNIFESMQILQENPQFKKIVKGFMIESFLEDGNQKININNKINLNGLSITDPCINWEKTENLILNLAEFLATDNCQQI